MLISVIVPTYNYAPYIGEAVSSALNQGLSGVEVIVVNDGSTDHTKEVIKPYLSRIRLIDQSNKGVSAARNNGIANSSGEFIAFLDADDRWMPEKLKKQLEHIRGKTEIGMVHTGATFIDNQGNAREAHISDFPKHPSGSGFEGLFLGGNGICTSSILVRRSCLEECGFFNERMSYAEDYDLWLRIATKYQIGFVDEPLVNYRIHCNASVVPNPDHSASLLTLLRRILKDFPDNAVLIGQDKVRMRLFRLTYKIFRLYKENGNRSKAASYMLLALKMNPLLFAWESLTNSRKNEILWYIHRLEYLIGKK